MFSLKIKNFSNISSIKSVNILIREPLEHKNQSYGYFSIDPQIIIDEKKAQLEEKLN